MLSRDPCARWGGLREENADILRCGINARGSTRALVALVPARERDDNYHALPNTGNL